MGGVGRPKTSVRVGDTEGGSEEQGVRDEAESGGLQGCGWEGRLLGGVEVRAAAAAALVRIPESSVGGLVPKAPLVPVGESRLSPGLDGLSRFICCRMELSSVITVFLVSGVDGGLRNSGG